jgi:hypothetical protein
MLRRSASVVAAAGVISGATAASRTGLIAVRTLAASPASFADGRVWLLGTSALLADRPAAASLFGFLLVGLAAVHLCGPRIAWTAAAGGHVLSALAVYLAVGLARMADPGAAERVLRLPDYGTSAVIAAWIGAIAYVLWSRGRPAGAVSLVVVAALAGWYFKGSLTVIDTEHAVALAVGAAAMRFLPTARLLRLGIPHLRLRRGCTI